MAEGRQDNRDAGHPRFTVGLTGHEDAEKSLLDACRSGRLHHAWLLGGPQGIGKATLAYRFARYLLAEGGKNAAGEDGANLFGEAPEKTAATAMEMDADHPIFRRIAAGGHGNLRTIERVPDEKTGRMRGEIVVDDIRRLRGVFTTSAAEGGWRIVIIDSADEMNRNASNALLKLLEEPPEKSILLLVAHRPGILPATIRSRCRVLTMAPLGDEAVAGILAGRLPGLAAEERLALARLAAGAPGRALALAGEGGLDIYRRVIGLLESLPGLKIADSHALADELAGRGAERRYHVLTGLLIDWIGELVRAGARGEQVPEITGGEGRLARRLSERAGSDRWLAAWQKMGELVERGERQNLDRKQTVLALLGQLEGVFTAS